MDQPRTASRQAAPDPRRWTALLVVCASVVIVVLDNTILNVALPTLSRQLGADTTALQWIVDSYSVVFAAFVLVGGAIGDRWGRSNALIAGLAVFGLGSLGAAMSDSTESLIAFRIVTGLGSAVVFPATLAVITEAFQDSSERAKAIGIWSAMAGIGVAIGPVAGGVLLRHFWWGSVFIVNVPVVLACVVGAAVAVPRIAGDRSHRIDGVGAAMSAAGIGALVFAVIEGPARGWTDAVVVGSALGAVAILVGFVAWERRVEHPMIDLSVFANRAFSAASGAIAGAFFVLFGTLFLMTQQLQAALGYDALKAGLATMPMAVVLMVVAPASPAVAQRFGVRATVTAGLALMSLGCAAWTATPGRGYLPLAAALTVLSIGIALVMAPATDVVMASLPASKAGIASGVNDATREVGGALGVAVAGSIASGVYRSGVEDLRVPGAVLDAVTGSVSAAHGVLAGMPGGDALVLAVNQAFGDGVRVAMTVLALGCLAATVAVWRAFAFTPAPAEEGDAGLAVATT